jgi:hypothetical protein
LFVSINGFGNNSFYWLLSKDVAHHDIEREKHNRREGEGVSAMEREVRVA